MELMLRNLLEERFHLKVRREQRISDGYALIIAKGGSKLQPTKDGQYFAINSGVGFKVQNDSIADFAKMIEVLAIKKPVADRTGLDGQYDFDLKFVPDERPLRDNPLYANLPDIFTAVQGQLGLKLVPQKVPVDFIIVDHVERLSEN